MVGPPSPAVADRRHCFAQSLQAREAAMSFRHRRAHCRKRGKRRSPEPHAPVRRSAGSTGGRSDCEDLRGGNPHATGSLAEAADRTAAAMEAAAASGPRAALSPRAQPGPSPAWPHRPGPLRGRWHRLTASPATRCRSGKGADAGTRHDGPERDQGLAGYDRSAIPPAGDENRRPPARRVCVFSGPSTNPAYSIPGSRAAKAMTSERIGPSPAMIRRGNNCKICVAAARTRSVPFRCDSSPMNTAAPCDDGSAIARRSGEATELSAW